MNCYYTPRTSDVGVVDEGVEEQLGPVESAEGVFDKQCLQKVFHERGHFGRPWNVSLGHQGYHLDDALSIKGRPTHKAFIQNAT